MRVFPPGHKKVVRPFFNLRLRLFQAFDGARGHYARRFVSLYDVARFIAQKFADGFDAFTKRNLRVDYVGCGGTIFIYLRSPHRLVALPSGK